LYIKSLVLQIYDFEWNLKTKLRNFLPFYSATFCRFTPQLLILASLESAGAAVQSFPSETEYVLKIPHPCGQAAPAMKVVLKYGPACGQDAQQYRWSVKMALSADK
jgi:hypothetical protein